MTIQQDIILNVKAKNTNSVSGAVKAATQSASSGAANAGIGSAKIIQSGLNKVGSGITGVIRSIMVLAKPLFTLLGIATGIAGLVMSSKSLQMMLDRIGKILLMFLRPIADMLSILLMPLLMFLKPMAMFINALMKPYIQEARNAMRVSAQLRKAGDVEGANEALGKGALILGTGLMKMLVVVGGEVTKFLVDIFANQQKLIVDVFAGLGTIILSALGASSQSIDNWNSYMGEFKNQIDAGTNVLKAMVDVGVEQASKGLDGFKDQLVEDIGKLKDRLDPLNTSTENVSSAQEKLNIALEDLILQTNTTNNAFKVFSESLGLDFIQNITDVVNAGLDESSEKAKSFAEALKNMFPEMFGNEDGTTNSAANLLGAGLQIGPLDELFGIFQGAVTGDIGKVFEELINLINPIHSLFEIANLVITGFTELQTATMNLHGEGGHGFVELQTEVSKSIGLFGKNNEIVIRSTSSMNDFNKSTVRAIKAIDSAVSQAKNFAEQARKAASAAKKASNDSSSSKSKTAQDVILRPNGEAIYTNPNDTIIATRFGNNLPGAGGNGSNMTFNITVNANDGNEMKKYLDQFVRDTMRKYA